MSTAVGKVTLIALPNGVTYSTMIACSRGDVRQFYNESKVSPDWEATASLRPVLTLHCVASTNVSGETVPANITLYYDGVKLTIPAGSDTNAAAAGCPAGMFKVSGGGAEPWRVTVCKNYVSPGTAAQAGHILRIEGELADGSGKVQASMPFGASYLTEGGYAVSIVGSGGNPFVVDQTKGTSATLRAEIYSGGEPLATPAGFHYLWQKMGASGWSPIANSDVAQITVGANDVDAYAEYRVIVRKGAAVTSDTDPDTFSDTQSVMDIGDPWYVAIEVTSDGTTTADMQFAAGSTATEKRVLKASLKPREGTATAPTASCRWKLMRPDGTLLNSQFSGGQNSDGVKDQHQDSATIEIPYKFLTDNSVTALEAVAVLTFG